MPETVDLKTEQAIKLLKSLKDIFESKRISNNRQAHEAKLAAEIYEDAVMECDRLIRDFDETK